MSAIWRVTETDAAAPGIGLGRIASPIRALAEHVHTLVRTYLARRRTQRQLAHLDDRLLHDIGIGHVHRAGNLRGIAEALEALTAPLKHL
jgi:uncharacterized protein YjiS (DUF1127 family)